MTDAAGRRFVLATGNKHKVHEVTRILNSLGVDCEIVSMYEACESTGVSIPDIVEDSATFTDNALIKARTIAQLTGQPALADDSGLSVDALGGMPGIFSARWSGNHGDDAGNLNLVLAQLTDVPDGRRQAAFVCSVALVMPGFDGGSAAELIGHGEVHGSLLHSPRGENGFGYDPIFVPDGFERTTAEMTAEQKDELSHRRRALEQLVAQL